MSKTTKTIPTAFAKFMGGETKTATVKELDGAEIQYRTLTVKENDDFNKKLMKGVDDNGKPIFDYDNMSNLRYEKIALCLIEPKMTVEELSSLDSSATKALIEIEGLISGLTADELDDEGK